MMTDPIADMLARIRNASLVKKPIVDIPFSKLKWELARVLSSTGFVGEVSRVEEETTRPQVRIALLYVHGAPRISEITRVSKPGLRVYVGSKKIPAVRNAYGMCIVSTPAGLLTGDEAKKKGIGGELLCTVA